MTTTTPTLTETLFGLKTSTPDHYTLSELTYSSPVEVLNVRFSDLPKELRDLIAERDGLPHGSAYYTLAFYEAPCPGQTSTGTPNWNMFLAPTYRTPQKNQRQFIVGKAGCKHNIETTNLGRCYNRYTCTKCGYSYSVDSSD